MEKLSIKSLILRVKNTTNYVSVVLPLKIGLTYNTKMFDDLQISIKKLQNKMSREIKIITPEGYEIDKENSTFELIKIKKKGKIINNK